MKFEHPLVRSAKTWRAYPREGEDSDVLVIVTTLELDPEAKKYKPELVDKLRAAARLFLTEHPAKGTGFVLMNKPKH